MKNFIFIIALAISCLFAFLAFTDSGLEDLKNNLQSFEQKIQDSNKIIASQTECIDDLESSLYDFSTEIINLRAENTYLIDQNRSLKNELSKYAKKAASLRSEMTKLEINNHNLQRQLDMLIKGREIRAKHKSNSNIANNDPLVPSPDADGSNTIESNEIAQITETQSKIEEIQTALEQRSEALAKIEQSTQETFTSIQNNEAKIQFNIDVEPQSNPTVEYSDPLVSQEVLYPAPVESPKLFGELEMVDNEETIASIDPTEEEFSSKSPVYSLLENTTVIYNYVACRNDKYGRKIKKLKGGAKNWKYTFMQFNLETENVNLLLDKTFRMRVLSTDLNTYVNFTTDKSVKSTCYFDFNYEGEPIKISLYNEKNIKGKSFDIQIFHIVDGEEYLLEDYQQNIFKDGIQTFGKFKNIEDTLEGK